MTIDQMRAVLGLDPSLTDADVVAAYAAFIASLGSEPLLTLQQVKTFLKIEPEQTEEDDLIRILATAAQRAIENKLGQRLGPDFPVGDLPIVTQAMQLLIGSWFRNRGANVVGLSVAEMPLAVTWLIDPLRVMSA